MEDLAEMKEESDIAFSAQLLSAMCRSTHTQFNLFNLWSDGQTASALQKRMK